MMNIKDMITGLNPNQKKEKQVSRRNFLGTMTAVGGTTVLGASLLKSCKKEKGYEELGLPPLLKRAPDGPVLKAGLVGCGNRGTGAALNFLSAGPNLKLVALADVFEDKVQECRKKLKGYKIEVPESHCFNGFDAYQRLIESGVDVVLLATPPYFRAEQFKACVEAGKHVFMEKPVAVDAVGARSIMVTSKKAEALGLSVITGTQRRHQKDYIETYRQIANGAIGQPVAARAWWNQAHVWFRTREAGWNDMEYMLRNWNNFYWLSGDHFLDTHVHNIDVVNWFMDKHPVAAVGYGGRHRRITGNQYDFFSVDFEFGNGLYSHSMSRQIDNCANGKGEMIMGTTGYTNCQNKIYNLDGTLKWKYEYPKDKDGKRMTKVPISPYIQEHIDFVTAIRTNKPIVEAERCAISTLTAIMGRTSAYTGKRITWEDMMRSPMKLGPKSLEIGSVEMDFPVPIPGTQHKA